MKDLGPLRPHIYFRFGRWSVRCGGWRTLNWGTLEEAYEDAKYIRNSEVRTNAA